MRPTPRIRTGPSNRSTTWGALAWPATVSTAPWVRAWAARPAAEEWDLPRLAASAAPRPAAPADLLPMGPAGLHRVTHLRDSNGSDPDLEALSRRTPPGGSSKSN